MKKRTLFFLFVSLLLVASSGRSEIYPEAGTRSAPVLTDQPGARPRAMGGAFTAVPDDPNAIWFNPAGLGTIRHLDFAATHRRLSEGVNREAGGMVIPLSFLTSPDLSDFGALSLSFGYLDYGSIEGRDATGVSLGNDAFNHNDWVAGVGYGRAFGRYLSLGASAKLYKLAVTGKKGVAVDAGVLFSPSPRQWGLGLSLLNFGDRVSYLTEQRPLPGKLAAGLYFRPAGDAVLFTADILDSQTRYMGYRAGVEGRLGRIVALRAGYDSTNDAGDGLTLGLGFNIHEFEAGFFPIRRLSIDYSFAPADDFGDLHTVTLSFRLGEK